MDAGEGTSSIPLQDLSHRQNPVEGPRKRYTFEYNGVQPHVRTGKSMITLLYRFNQGRYKIAQLNLAEFQESNILQEEIKRIYGDEKLNEILNDPSLIVKGRHLISQAWRGTGTYKKLKLIRADVGDFMTKLKLLPRVPNDDEVYWVPERFDGDPNSPEAAQVPLSRIYYGNKGELIRLLAEAHQAERDEAAKKRSREVGLQEAIDAVWNAENSEGAEDARRRALGLAPLPSERGPEVHGPASPQEMQAPQQISSEESPYDEGWPLPRQANESPYDYIVYDPSVEAFARIPAGFKTSRSPLDRQGQTDTHHSGTPSEPVDKGKSKDQGPAPQEPARHPSAARSPNYRPMPPGSTVCDWHEDDLPLITEEQYRYIVHEEMEDDKPRHLKKREPRHPVVREYHHRLLEKADRIQFEMLQDKAREEARRDQEQAEYEADYMAMAKLRIEDLHPTESGKRSEDQEDREEDSFESAQSQLPQEHSAEGQEQLAVPSTGRSGDYHPMSPGVEVSEWHEDDLPLITKEQYRRIILDELEDEKAPNLRTREPRHPVLREYQRRLLAKADRYNFEKLHEKEKEDVKKEVEQSEQEAVSERQVERINKMESSIGSQRREDAEQVGARPQQQSGQHSSAQQSTSGENPTRHASKQSGRSRSPGRGSSGIMRRIRKASSGLGG